MAVPLVFDSVVCVLLGVSLTVWFTLLLVFIVTPAVFGLSFGIRRLYMKTLLKVFQWATLRIERGAKEKNHQLYKPYAHGIIAKEPTSLEEELTEIRRSGSNRELDVAAATNANNEISTETKINNDISTETKINNDISTETKIINEMSAATNTNTNIDASLTTSNNTDISTTTNTNNEICTATNSNIDASLATNTDTDASSETNTPTSSMATSVSLATNCSSSSAEFELSDLFWFCRRGVESIVDDEVTKRFSAEELETWNLLTRSNYNCQHLSSRLTVLWGLGVLIRYGFLLPLRVTLAFTGVSLLVVFTTIIGLMPNCRAKSFLSETVHLMCYRICVRALTAIITYHHSENKPKNGGICVANHTSPIDVIILASDGCYSMVGQIHGGLMGVIQRSMVKAAPHIWFERSEVKDRHLVAKRLSDHVEDKTKSPILIFPEGTCINNTSVMMFKKGSFEIASTVYPVAIKYDPRFGDAFWNSSKFGMVSYLLHMMSSWAIVCSVWYLPPMTRQEGEDAVQFANRVKAAIARQGGLVDLLWDGGLKRGKVKDTFKEEQQKLYSKILTQGTHTHTQDRSRS
ncbi:glycerol-3-phosphate acyltransferase 4-like [Engraulis encrasicolus]|uniref:glycerol-3-phosphate acyltransferase 4-like n=1 Tax=Engraulis encrasicolus TaxID=184585 RepID=UPI002FD39FCA